MRNMYIYEASPCCEPGTCGCDSDKDLVRVENIVDVLRKNGASITRYNYENDKAEFEDNKIVANLLDQSGEDVLPIIMVNKEVVITSRYPTEVEFHELLVIADEIEDFEGFDEDSDGSCGCGGTCSC